MTVSISQQQQHPHEDIHIKRKASESLENEQRLSKRFHRLNIQSNSANNHIPTTSNGRSASTQAYQYPTQNGYSVQPYQLPSATINSATATSPTQYILPPQTHNANNHEIQPDISTTSPISPSYNSTSDPEAMQIEDLPRKFVSPSPSLIDDEDDVGSVSNATDTTDDDDNEDTRSKNKTKNRKDRVILIPTIDKHIDKIPDHLLRQDKRNALTSSSAGNDTKNKFELVLYSDPSSLSVPREQDSVRKVILEARARARLGGTIPGSGPGPGKRGGTATSSIPAYTPRSVPETMATDSAGTAARTTATGGRGGGGGGGGVFDGTTVMAMNDAFSRPPSFNSSISPLAAPTGAPAPVPAVSPSPLPLSDDNNTNVGLSGPSLDGDAMDID